MSIGRIVGGGAAAQGGREMSSRNTGKKVFFFFLLLLSSLPEQRSRAAQLDEIAAGNVTPAARSRDTFQAVVDEEADDVELYDDEDLEDEQQMYEFVDTDNAGELAPVPSKVKVTRKPRAFRTGVDPKDADLFVVDSFGKRLPASDGVVKINLARLILRPVTDEEIESKRFFAGFGIKRALVDSGCFRCCLRGDGPDHPEFERIGLNTGNLMKHAAKHHQPMLDALATLISETPAAQAVVSCELLITNAPPPMGILDRFVSRDNKAIRSETLCLVWFLDANIAFSQFDNPLFRKLIEMLGGRAFPSSTTMVESILPLLYRFATDYMRGILQEAGSFINSFDGWSRFGHRFLSQSYHCISPKTFSSYVMALDLIYTPVQHFQEVLGGLLAERQEFWTAGMSPEPIAAGGIADGASDVQSAGRGLWAGEDNTDASDMSRCQNHKLKGAYELLERKDPALKIVVDSLAAFFISVSNSANVSTMLKSYQRMEELVTSTLYVYNETRWEGRVKLLDCALKLKDSLPELKPFAAAHKIGADCGDFLEESFFVRVRTYLEHLDVVNSVSKLFQTQKFPTGHLVVLCYAELYNHFAVNENDMDRPFEQVFKRALHSTILEMLVEPVSSKPTAFLKAAFFHPDICWRLQNGLITKSVYDQAVEAIKVDIAAFDGNDSATTMVACSAFDSYLRECGKIEPPQFTGFKAVLANGVYGSTDALSFWRTIVEKPGGDYRKMLVPVAAMLLALPAGESHDEFVFSATGRIFTKDRNALSPARLEQITILVMFIRNFGWSQHKLNKWVELALAQVKETQ